MSLAWKYIRRDIIDVVFSKNFLAKNQKRHKISRLAKKGKLQILANKRKLELSGKALDSYYGERASAPLKLPAGYGKATGLEWKIV